MDPYRIETQGKLQPFDGYEWLLTNGMGGFASSTVVGCNARRYHGLLVAAMTPPVGRMVMLSRLGEVVVIDGDENQPHDISINRFKDLHFPRGDQYLLRFELRDTADWHYHVDGVLVHKQVLMAWERNAVAVRYNVAVGQKKSVRLKLGPFIAMRDFHGCRHASHGAPEHAHTESSSTFTQGDHRLTISSADAMFEPEGSWWHGHTYDFEYQRGMGCDEDLYTPGAFVTELSGDGSVTIVASMDDQPFDWDAELKRRQQAFAYADQQPTPTLQKLARAAGDYIVQRKTPDGAQAKSIHAGYPWFSDWGRDAMISLPGLLLTTKRLSEAGEVLKLFGNYVSEGMIPNRFDDYDSHPHFNTVDASLWFIHACFEFRQAGGDVQLFDNVLLPACKAIVEGYRNGTRFDICMDPEDGLITQGNPSTQLTWMDAKTDGVAFTPREGKAVEINALWYHALRLLNDPSADKVQTSFVQAFWLNPFRGLADVVRTVDGQLWQDTAVRINQMFAVSLPHSALNEEQQRAVVEAVRRELLTPLGMRTLSPNSDGYRGRYEGGPYERDSAYHNGTAWPWPTGAFLYAYLRTEKFTEAAKQQATEWLRPLIDSLQTGCIGQIAEVYDGDEPQRAAGCCAQAWSVAETLRLAAVLGVI